MQKWMFQGNRVYFQKEGSGRPLLFLHNAGTSHEIWKNQVASFSKYYACYALDLPGYGQSVGMEDPTSLEFYTQCITQFIAQNQLSRVTLIGNCLGSTTALSYGLLHPQHVEKLILFHLLTPSTVNAGVFKLLFQGTEHVQFTRRLLRNLLCGAVLPVSLSQRMVRYQLGKDSAKLRAQVDSLVTSLRQPGVLKSLGDLLVDLDSFSFFDQMKFTERLPETWIFWGTENRILPLQAGETLCERAQPYRFEKILGGGHLVMFEQPDVVNALLAEALADDEPRISTGAF